MHAVAPVLLAIFVTLPGPLTFAEVENEPPLVDAGLDQQVALGTTVYLDGTGSRDPDGRITAYEWTVHGPSGVTATLDCPSCQQTSFTPRTAGRYAVTLTAKDGRGATRRDTLYVTVESSAKERERPTVSLRGPRTPETGTQAAYTAAFEVGSAPLDTVTWLVDGRDAAVEALDGTTTESTYRRVFRTQGRRTVSVRITDEDGLTDTARLQVVPHTQPAVPQNEHSEAQQPGQDATEAPSTGGHANQPPSVEIEAPMYVDPGGMATIRANASDPDGYIADFAWNTGDENASFEHLFPDDPGLDIDVRVEVWDNLGATATDAKTVHLRPNASIVGPSADCVDHGAVATFDAEVDAGGDHVVDYDWRNANGIGAWGERAIHRFDEAPGTVVEIGLTVRDEDGATDRTSTEVTVCPKPENNTAPVLHTVGGAGVLLSGGQYRTQEPNAFDQVVLVRGGTVTQVKFWAHATDEESEILTYTWTSNGRLIGRMKLRTGELASFYHKFTFGKTGPGLNSYARYKRGQPHEAAVRWKKQRTVVLTVTDENGGSTAISRNITFRQGGPASRPVPAFFRLTTNRSQVRVGEPATVFVGSKTNRYSPSMDGFRGTYRLAWGDGGYTKFEPPQDATAGFATRQFQHEYAAVGVYPVQIAGPGGTAIQSTRDRLLLTVQKGRAYTEYHWQKILRYNDTVVSPTKPGPGYERRGVNHTTVSTYNQTATVRPSDTTLLDTDWTYRRSIERPEESVEYQKATTRPGPEWTLRERNVGTTRAFDHWETVVFEDESDVLGDWQFVRTVDDEVTVRESRSSPDKPRGEGWMRGWQVGTVRDGWESEWFDTQRHAFGDWRYVGSRERVVARHTHGHDHDRTWVPGYYVTNTETYTATRDVCGSLGCMAITEPRTREVREWVNGYYTGHDHDTWTEVHTDTEYQFKRPRYVPEYRWSRETALSDTDYEYRRKTFSQVPVHLYERTTVENQTYYVYEKQFENKTTYYEWVRPMETVSVVTDYYPTQGVIGPIEEHKHFCGEAEGNLQEEACLAQI